MIDAIEVEITLISSDDAEIRFKYKRENGGSTIERTITPGAGGPVSFIDVDEIRRRAEDLKIVADHFDALAKIPVT